MRSILSASFNSLRNRVVLPTCFGARAGRDVATIAPFAPACRGAGVGRGPAFTGPNSVRARDGTRPAGRLLGVVRGESQRRPRPQGSTANRCRIAAVAAARDDIDRTADQFLALKGVVDVGGVSHGAAP